MQTKQAVIWRFFSSFFFFFGLLEFLFFVRKAFPQFGAASGDSLQDVLCAGAAALLAVLYTLISVDRQQREEAVKARLLICAVPCVLICGVLSVYYGLPSLLLELFGIADRGASAMVWVTGCGISCAAFGAAFCLLERHYRRIGKVYDAALRAYQQADFAEEAREEEM